MYKRCVVVDHALKEEGARRVEALATAMEDFEISLAVPAALKDDIQLLRV